MHLLQSGGPTSNDERGGGGGDPSVSIRNRMLRYRTTPVTQATLLLLFQVQC